MGIGVFCSIFNKVSPVGYHSDAIILKNSHEDDIKIFHFAVLPHDKNTYVIHEMVSGIKGRALSTPMALGDALKKAHQLFNLKIETLRTAVSDAEAVKIMGSLAPLLEGFTWQHAREAPIAI